MFYLLVALFIVSACGPIMLVAGLVIRHGSRKANLLERPPLPTAKIADGRPLPTPRGTATDGGGAIAVGLILSVMFLLLTAALGMLMTYPTA